MSQSIRERPTSQAAFTHAVAIFTAEPAAGDGGNLSILYMRLPGLPAALIKGLICSLDAFDSRSITYANDTQHLSVGVQWCHEILLHASVLLHSHIACQALDSDINSILQEVQLLCRAMERRAYRRKAEVQSASFPWQVGEWALLLLLVKRPQELQVYLPVLGHQIAVLQPELWRNLADLHNHLDGHMTLSMHSF